MENSYLWNVDKRVSIPSGCTECWSHFARAISWPSGLITVTTHDLDLSCIRATFWECANCGQRWETVSTVNNLPLKEKASGQTVNSVRQESMQQGRIMRETLRAISPTS